MSTLDLVNQGYEDHERYWHDRPTRRRANGGRALTVVLSTFLVVAALWMGAVTTWLLARALPAVLPGTTVSIPVVTPLMGQLPGDLAITAPGMDHPFNEPITILLMGVDKRPGESDLSVRTDSIAVVRLDPATHQVTILSVPRDLWVAIHAADGEAYWERINVSYSEGAHSGGSVDAGARQLGRDLEANFGLAVDHYIWLDMAGTRQLIDALGGVDVTIPESLSVPDWRYTEDDVTNPRVLSFPAGSHHLSGYEAVAFSRYRGDSDLFRAQRQQLVLRALLSDPFSLQLMLNPFRAWYATSMAMKSDLSTARLAGLALLAKRSSENTELYSLGEPVNGSPTVFPFTTGSGAAVLDWDEANVAYWVEQARSTR